MARGRSLRWLFYINLLVVGFLIGYKLYLNLYEQDFTAVHARQVERIQARLQGENSFSFAVVGNINNSVGIFERKIVPMLNAADLDFVVSAGNAVSGGGEDKYRALHRTLKRLRMPYLLTFGENENSGLGSFRFYEHFGPYFFAFSASDNRFVFLDSTGKSSPAWQLRWLRDELESSDSRHTFLFTGHPVQKAARETFLDGEDDYLRPIFFRRGIQRLAEKNGVDAVFSANLPVFDRQRHNGTTYITTGGAGGLVLNNDASYYHFVKVMVGDEGMTISPVQLDIGQHPVFKTLESFWFFVHSLFYVGYLNFILLVSVFSIAAIWLYTRVFMERDYYPAFDIDTARYQGMRFRVAMFTNNYRPFIGGVPLSIDRLRLGLKSLGHRVLVIAPEYETRPADDGDSLRVPSVLAFGQRREFRVGNLLLPRIRHRVKAFRPDVIHVHHPFWLGSLGLFLARRLKVPIVYTYHTRLEHYAHYVPLPSVLFRNLISHYLVKRFANRCDAVIVPTQSAEEYLRLIGVKTAIFVQPTSVDYAAYRDIDRHRVDRLRKQLGIGDEKVLVSVARLSKEKNIDFLVDAVAILKRQCGTSFRLLMIGDGEERRRLQARIDSLGLTREISLLGAVPPSEMPLYYALGDAFLFASKSETQGMVIVEAMAAGLPVVAIRSSGIDDVVRDGVTGFKTPENHKIWADKVHALLADEELRQFMAESARQFAARFSIDAVAGEVVEVYAYALALRSSGKSALV